MKDKCNQEKQLDGKSLKQRLKTIKAKTIKNLTNIYKN